MIFEILAYPFLFATLYFEVFLLVTLLSSTSREARERLMGAHAPNVAMIVPCYNEEGTVKATVESLLALDYPKESLHLVLVNDGSTDGTKDAMNHFTGNPRITIIHQKNSGKHAALNAGITASTNAELVGCLDADSFVEKGALKAIVPCFDKPNVAAATSAMSVHNPRNVLEHMQNAEYVFGIAARHILASVNGIYVTPGPFSLYRKEVIQKLGGFRHGHNTEDMEMALRIQRAGFHIENAPLARVFTKAPHTLQKLIKQRTRWTTGFLRNVLMEYRDLVGNPRYGSLGLLVLPLAFLAVVGGIVLFFVGLYQLVRGIVDVALTTNGVPLSYTLMPHFSFEWFYLPTTAFIIFGIIGLVVGVVFIIIGRQVSKTQSPIGGGIVAYVFLYMLIAPFWLIRALVDVASGFNRTWR